MEYKEMIYFVLAVVFFIAGLWNSKHTNHLSS